MRRWLPLLLIFVLAAGAFFWLSDDDDATVRLIVLITPDTLRRDHVGVYGKGNLTPKIDAWAKDATRFLEARTPVPLTLPGHVTMLAGLAPGATGVRTNAERLPTRSERGFSLLSERLREAGWHTAAFVSASVLNADTGLAEAFDHYDDGNLREQGSLSVPERHGRETVRAARAHMRAHKGERLFLWVHLFDPHAPYSESGRYDGGVRTVDDAIGSLLDELEGLDACVLIASDHGEALGDLGEPSHGVLLGDAVLRIPFLLRTPGLPPGERLDPAELADVAPTLAAAAGLNWPAGAAPGSGRSLLTAGPSARPSLAESLDGHRRYRWAQLIGASDERGTLVDAGEGRFHWFPRAAPGQDQAGPEPAEGTVGLDTLVDLIASYKQISTPLAEAGTAPAYYTNSGPAGPLLDPAVNARLPDPYQVIGRATVFARIAQTIRGAPPAPGILEQALSELKRLERVDPGNPEVAFWQGQAHERMAAGESDSRRSEAARARASRAYLRAYERGRKDPTTIVRAAGINAPADLQAALDLLRRLARHRTHEDCQILMLEARLLRDLGQDADADAICKRAKALCGAAGGERLWSRTCAGQ